LAAPIASATIATMTARAPSAKAAKCEANMALAPGSGAALTAEHDHGDDGRRAIVGAAGARQARPEWIPLRGRLGGKAARTGQQAVRPVRVRRIQFERLDFVGVVPVEHLAVL